MTYFPSLLYRFSIFVLLFSPSLPLPGLSKVLLRVRRLSPEYPEQPKLYPLPPTPPRVSLCCSHQHHCQLPTRWGDPCNYCSGVPRGGSTATGVTCKCGNSPTLGRPPTQGFRCSQCKICLLEWEPGKRLLLEIVLGLVPIPGPGFSQLCICMHLTAMELNLGMRLATYFTGLYSQEYNDIQTKYSIFHSIREVFQFPP